MSCFCPCSCGNAGWRRVVRGRHCGDELHLPADGWQAGPRWWLLGQNTSLFPAQTQGGWTLELSVHQPYQSDLLELLHVGVEKNSRDNVTDVCVFLCRFWCLTLAVRCTSGMGRRWLWRRGRWPSSWLNTCGMAPLTTQTVTSTHWTQESATHSSQSKTHALASLCWEDH